MSLNRKGLTSLGNKWIIGLILAAVLLSVFAVGCKPDTPEAAAEAFFNAIDNGNWNAFLDSILPDNVRAMTPEEKTYQKETFESDTTEYKGLKFKAEIDRKDNSKAVVTITGGTVTQENPLTGESQVIDFATYEEDYGSPATIDAEKYKNRWYISIPLSQSASVEEGEIEIEEGMEEIEDAGQ